MNVADGSYGSGPVLFDLDGTLVDSAPGITAAINETLVAHGAPQVAPAALLPRIGPPLHETFAELLADRALSADELDAMVADYRRRYAVGMVAGSTPYLGIRELLTALHGQGRTLAVATSKAQHLAEGILEGLGLRDLFTVVSGPVPPARENKTGTIAKALARLGALGEGAVMIGDRLHDVEGALANGLPVIGVLYGFGSREELSAAGAGAIADDVPGLARLLGAG